MRSTLLALLLLSACGERLPARSGLTVDPLPASTDAVVVTVSGRASPGALVSVQGGAAPASATAGADGRFEAPVALRVGLANRLVVFPRVAGVDGDSAEVAVEQRVAPLVPALDRAPPPLPELDPVGPAVASTVVRLRGAAAGAVSVVVRDPYQIQPAAVGAGGRFEAVVRLPPNAFSSIAVTAIDDAGRRSIDAVRNLQHDPTLISPSSDAPPV